jgi:hypothetical protein
MTATGISYRRSGSEEASQPVMKGLLASEALSASDKNESLCLKACFNPLDLLLILGTAPFVFSPKKLPELSGGIGDGLRGVRSATKEHGDSWSPKKLRSDRAESHYEGG